MTAVQEPDLARRVLERVIPYFPEQLVARSLDRVAPTWLHEGRWGCQRTELMAPYSRWLADRGLVGDSGVWAAAVTNDYLPSPSAHPVATTSP